MGSPSLIRLMVFVDVYPSLISLTVPVDVKHEERRKRPMNRFTYRALRDTSGEDNRQKRHLIMALVSVVD